jgi:hypothetical protein
MFEVNLLKIQEAALVSKGKGKLFESSLVKNLRENELSSSSS